MPILIKDNKISVHAKFWDALTKNSDSLALSQLWLCCFDLNKLAVVGDKIHTELQLYERDLWSRQQDRINEQVLKLMHFFDVGTKISSGYLLTQGVTFIPDGINSSRIGFNQIGAMKGLISEGRLELNTASISFLETNVSFVDGFIRPWMALVGHKSLKDPNLRIDMQFLCLEKWGLKTPLNIRKSMVFRNAVPINVDAEEYNYSADKLIIRQTQFAFDNYETHINPKITQEEMSGVLEIIKIEDPPEQIFSNAQERTRTIFYTKKPLETEFDPDRIPAAYVPRGQKDDPWWEYDLAQTYIKLKHNFRSGRVIIPKKFILNPIRKAFGISNPILNIIKHDQDMMIMEDDDFKFIDPSTSKEKDQKTLNKNILNIENESYRINTEIKRNDITYERVTNENISPINPSKENKIDHDNIMPLNPSKENKIIIDNIIPLNPSEEKTINNSNIVPNDFLQDYNINTDLKPVEFEKHDINANIRSNDFTDYDVRGDIKLPKYETYDINANIIESQNKNYDIPVIIKNDSYKEYKIETDIKLPIKQNDNLRANIIENIKNVSFDEHKIEVELKSYIPQKSEMISNAKIITP